MCSTGPIISFNCFEISLYDILAHFRQYLENRITKVGLELLQNLRIIREALSFTQHHNKKKSNGVRILQSSLHHLIPKLYVLEISPTEELDWPVWYGIQCRPVQSTCHPDYNLRFLSKNAKITCVHNAQNLPKFNKQIITNNTTGP